MRATRALLALALLSVGPAFAQEGDAEPSPTPKARTASVAVPAPSKRPKAPAPVKLKSDPAIAVPKALPVSGVEEIRARLETRAAYLRKGDKKNAEIELGHLLSLRASLGNVNVPLASTLLLQESSQALQAGDAAAAKAAAESAASLSPDMVPAHWARFRACLSMGDLGCVLASTIRAVTLRFDGFRNQVSTVTDLLGVGVLSVLALALLFGLLQLLRYGATATHDLAARLPGWAGDPVAAMLLALLMFAPLVGGLGLAGLAVVWLGATMLYQTNRERVVSGVLLGLLAVAPLAISYTAPLLMVHGSTVDDIARLASEAYALDAEARLEKTVAQGPDYEAAFLLARRAWANGDLDAAARWYRASLEANPSDVAAHNNLGIILFNQKNLEGALEQWKEAGTSRIEPILNAAALDLDKGRFEKAQEAIKYASRIDPERTRRFSEADSDPASRLLAIPFDQSRLWSRALAIGEPERAAIVSGLWSRLGGVVPWNVFPIFAVVLGALGALLGAKSSAFSIPCTKCGAPAHKEAKNGYCSQCQSIFLKAMAIDPALRFQKEDMIRRKQVRQRWTERLLGLIAGAGHVVAGRPIEGALTMLVVTVFFMHWLWMDRLSIHPWAAGVGIGAAHLSVVAVLGVIVAVISYRRAS